MNQDELYKQAQNAGLIPVSAESDPNRLFHMCVANKDGTAGQLLAANLGTYEALFWMRGYLAAQSVKREEKPRVQEYPAKAAEPQPVEA